MRKITVALVVIMALFFAACSDSWQENEGTFSISFGGGSHRSIVDWPLSEEIIAKLTCTIKLSGAGSEQNKTVSGEQTALFTVLPGFWNIDVNAYLDKELIAAGSWKGTIKSGSNGSIPIVMKQYETIISDGSVFVVSIAQIVNPDVMQIDSGRIIYLNGDPQTTEFKIENTGNYSYEWYLDDDFLGDADHVIITAGNNTGNIGTVGIKILTVIVTIDNVPYSKEIAFEVRIK